MMKSKFVILVWLADVGDKRICECSLFDGYVAPAKRSTSGWVEEVLTGIVREQQERLVAVLGCESCPRALVITLDSSKTSGDGGTKWADGLRKVIEDAGTYEESRLPEAVRTFASRASQAAIGFLVALPRLPYSVRHFTNKFGHDIEDSVRDRAEKDLREAIDAGFPPLPEKPKLFGLDVLRQGEEECEILHKAAVERFKQMLRDLEGFRGDSKEERHELARRVTKQAHRLGLVLMAQDETGKSVPVTVRCTRQRFEVRKSGGSLLGTYEKLPLFQVAFREDLTSALYR